MSIKLYKRGRGFNLYYQKFNYAMNSKYKEKIYWRCVNSICLGRISTNFDRGTILSGPFPKHNHIENIEYNNMLEMRRKILKEIDRNPLQPVSQSYKNAIIQQNIPPQVPTFKGIKSTLYRHRSIRLPKVPRSIASLAITGEWTRTLDEDRFLFKLDRDWGIVIFSSDWQLELMANCTTLLSDGTFKSAQKLFYQLYVIFGVVDDRKLPLSWVLLKNKTIGNYRRMLQNFKKELQRKNSDTAVLPKKNGET